MILHGDSLEILKTLDDNSIDSVVTDPPYGLSFMGKSWDYDVPQVELWQEVFRVLKPGGHLLSFAGSRTYHRMAVAIEDAGFEIRDQIMWVYGSGFPKSLNIGKAVDKLQGNEREDFGIDEARYKRLKNQLNSSNPTGTWQAGKRIVNITKGNSPYEGWGTALKPSHEPIVVARKPISEKNIAENVLRWGTGGINIDGCRVDLSENDSDLARINKTDNGIFGVGNNNNNNAQQLKEKGLPPVGRFPANFIHDGSDEVVGLMGDAHRFFYCAKASKSERNKGLEGFEEKHPSTVTGRKIGSAGAQNGGYAGMTETPRANIHPTVKPVKLMQYLVRLVTPKGGTVLDPFNGSGTTGIACKLEGFDYIGIEREAEYVEISKARIEAWETDKQMELIDV